MPSLNSPLPLIRCATSGCPASRSARAERSFHITNLPNEKLPRAASSATLQPSAPSIALRNEANTLSTATPEESSGSGSSPSTVIPNSAWRNSTRVALSVVSSSRRDTT